MYGNGNLLAVDMITYNRQYDLFLEYDLASPRNEISVKNVKKRNEKKKK